MSKVLELFGNATHRPGVDWRQVAERRWCPFLDRLCLKNRKSRPDLLIGTFSVAHGKAARPVAICPHRLLERNQIFTDCLGLLTLHEPGNEYHVVPEMTVPGGSVDYCLVSVRRGKVKDLVGIELQTLDTTGTVWPERQRFLQEHGLEVSPEDVRSTRPFGMNWKMTAKTILLQLHHKVTTFENLSKHLVLVIQDDLADYLRRDFTAGHLQEAKVGDSMHIHVYRLVPAPDGWLLELASRASTDAAGVARMLRMEADPNVELAQITQLLESKISDGTRLSFGPVSDVTAVTEPS